MQSKSLVGFVFVVAAAMLWVISAVVRQANPARLRTECL